MENQEEVVKLTLSLWEKLTPVEFAKADKIFHERVAYALGSDLHRFSVLRRLRDRLVHHESADLWKKEFYACKHSRIYLGALCRSNSLARSALAAKKAKIDEELPIVADCITIILAHGSSSFEQFAAECPSEFCEISELITQQSSIESIPSLVLFSRSLAKCNSESSVAFMISNFLSWHRILINLMKKKEECINGSLMQLLARLSSKEDYCQQLVGQSSDLVVISNCVVNSLSSSSDLVSDKQRLWACNCLHNLGSCSPFQRVVTSEARSDTKMLLGKGLVAMLKKEAHSADAARALINLSYDNSQFQEYSAKVAELPALLILAARSSRFELKHASWNCLANLSVHNDTWHAILLRELKSHDVLDLFTIRGSKWSSKSIELLNIASCFIGNLASSVLNDNVNWMTKSSEGTAQFGAIFDLVEYCANLPNPAYDSGPIGATTPMLSTDAVAVERIERVGTKRFFKTMLAVLHLSFDFREPDYACAVWTVASIIKACAALESRGIDCTGIQSMLADSAQFMIEYLRRCNPAWIYIRHCAKLFLFGLHIIFPRLVNLEAHPSRHDIQFKELAKEVQLYLISDGFEDVRETSIHVLWSLMWSPRHQQRIRKAEGFDISCRRLKQDAQSSRSVFMSPICSFLLDKIIAILTSSTQPNPAVTAVAGSKVAARMPALSVKDSAIKSASSASSSSVSAPHHHTAIADAAADEDHLILSSILCVKAVHPSSLNKQIAVVDASHNHSLEDTLCVDLLRPYLNFLPSEESIIGIEDIKQDLLLCYTNIDAANKAICSAYNRFGSLSPDALVACLYPRTSSLKRMHALLQQFIKTGKHLQQAHSKVVDSGHSLRCIEHVVNLCEDYLKFMIGAQKRLSDDVRAQAVHVDAVLLKRARSAESALHLVNRVRTFVHFDSTQFSTQIAALESWRSWCHDCLRQDAILVEAAKTLRASDLWDLLQRVSMQEKALDGDKITHPHSSKRSRGDDEGPLSEDEASSAFPEDESASATQKAKIVEFANLTCVVRDKLADLSSYVSTIRGKNATVFRELNSFAAFRQLRQMPLGLDRRLATVLAMTGLISSCENLIKGEKIREDVGLQVYDCSISDQPCLIWQYAIPGHFSGDSSAAINIPKIIGQTLIPHFVGSSFMIQSSRIFFKIEKLGSDPQCDSGYRHVCNIVTQNQLMPLSEFIDDRTRRCDPIALCTFIQLFKRCLQCVDAIHRMGLAHCQISLENIFIEPVSLSIRLGPAHAIWFSREDLFVSYLQAEDLVAVADAFKSLLTPANATPPLVISDAIAQLYSGISAFNILSAILSDAECSISNMNLGNVSASTLERPTSGTAKIEQDQFCWDAPIVFSSDQVDNDFHGESIGGPLPLFSNETFLKSSSATSSNALNKVERVRSLLKLCKQRMDDDDHEVERDSTLMHGSSVAAFASRIMELQAKDFFSSWTIDTPVDELVMRMQCCDDMTICVQHLVDLCCRLVESPNRCVAYTIASTCKPDDEFLFSAFARIWFKSIVDLSRGCPSCISLLWMPWSVDLFDAAVKFPDSPRAYECNFTSSVSSFVSSVKICEEASCPTSGVHGNAFRAFLSEFHRCWHEVFIPSYNLSLSQLLPHELAAVSVPIHDWRLDNVAAPSHNCKRLGDVWLHLPAAVDGATASALDAVCKILRTSEEAGVAVALRLCASTSTLGQPCHADVEFCTGPETTVSIVAGSSRLRICSSNNSNQLVSQLLAELGFSHLIPR